MLLRTATEKKIDVSNLHANRNGWGWQQHINKEMANSKYSTVLNLENFMMVKVLNNYVPKNTIPTVGLSKDESVQHNDLHYTMINSGSQ